MPAPWALASPPDRIRGSGRVKRRNVAAAKVEEAELLARFPRGICADARAGEIGGRVRAAASSDRCLPVSFAR